MTNSNARRVEGRSNRAGPSSAMRSSSRHMAKRQKLGDSEQQTKVSKYFFTGPSPHKHSPTVPSTSKSMHPNLATADAAIVVDEGDTSATNDDPHDPIVVKTSSPDPVDFLHEKPSYAFDQKKPTPMDQFSTSWAEKHKSSQDGASTGRVRRTLMKQNVSHRMESASRLGSDSDDLELGRPLLSRRSQSTARAKVSSGPGSVRATVAFFEEKDTPHLDLRTLSTQSRKDGMRPKQVGLFDVVYGCTCN